MILKDPCVLNRVLSPGNNFYFSDSFIRTRLFRRIRPYVRTILLRRFNPGRSIRLQFTTSISWVH